MDSLVLWILPDGSSGFVGFTGEILQRDDPSDFVGFTGGIIRFCGFYADFWILPEGSFGVVGSTGGIRGILRFCLGILPEGSSGFGDFGREVLRFWVLAEETYGFEGPGGRVLRFCVVFLFCL